MTTRRILVVDDEARALNGVINHLVIAGYSKKDLLGLQDPEKAFDRLEASPHEFDVVISDQIMNEMKGTALFNRMTGAGIRHPVRILLTGQSDEKSGIEAKQRGDLEALVMKPVENASVIEEAIDLAFRQRLIRGEAQGDLISIAERFGVRGGEAVQGVIQQIWRIARRERPISVLFLGPTGVGKTLFAHLLHHLSVRSDQPFVNRNCATIAPNLIQSTLFGHMKGSFTGALDDHVGDFERAHRGSLLLDEIVDIPLEGQAALLTAIQQGEIHPVGRPDSVQVDVRVMAATHKPVEQLIEDGAFREDLYYRIATTVIEIPPLCERPEDIAILAPYMADQLPLSADAVAMLNEYSWPGNLRQLENVLEQASVVEGADEDGIIEPRHLEAPLQRQRKKESHESGAYRTAEELEERAVLLEHVKKYHGHARRIAEAMGMSRMTVERRCVKLGIPIAEYRKKRRPKGGKS